MSTLSKLRTVSSSLIRVLLVEDGDPDAKLVRLSLMKQPTKCDQGIEFHLELARTCQQARATLQSTRFDVILLDLSLPDSQGLDTIRAIRAVASDAAIIVMSGNSDEEMAIQAVQTGVQDYLVKGAHVHELLVRSIRYAVERKQSELELHRKEVFTREVLDSLAAEVAVLNAQGVVVTANRSWLDCETCCHGIRAEPRNVGENWLEHMRRASADHRCAGRVVQGVEDVLSGKRRLFTHEYPCPQGAGTPAWSEIRITRLVGGQDGMVLSRYDITARRRAEELERRRASLQETLGTMERVLGIVGHELRTPLASIRGLSELMLSNEPPEDSNAKNYLRIINGESIRMADIVEDLLDAARHNSGHVPWHWSRVHLQPLCEEVVSTLAPIFRGEPVDLYHDVSPGDLSMSGDPGAIHRLVLNLTTNAVRSMKEGSVRVRVRQQAENGVRWVEIGVEDTGCGIAPEQAEHLGEPFQLSAGVLGPEHVRGTGLGLWICRAIAAAHGGTLKIVSRQGQGTTVTARLRADLPDAVASSDGPPVITRDVI